MVGTLMLLSVALSPASSVMLRTDLAKSSDASYEVVQTWREASGKTEYGRGVYRIRVRVRSSGGRQRLTIEGFMGKEGSPAETKQLQTLIPYIRQIRLVRPILPDRISEWQWASWNPAGAAGMMTARACGLYGVGPFDTFLPQKAVRIGESWSREVRVGSEAFPARSLSKISGLQSICRCWLKSLDPNLRRVVVGFRLSGTTKAVDRSLLTRNRPVSARQTFVQTGSWTVDLKSGLPVRFESRRNVEFTYGVRKTIDTMATTVRRI